jgi:hypothetical protein
VEVEEAVAEEGKWGVQHTRAEETGGTAARAAARAPR